MGIFVGGRIYVKAEIGKEKAALLVVIGVMRGGQKRFLALESGIERVRNRGRWCFGS